MKWCTEGVLKVSISRLIKECTKTQQNVDNVHDYQNMMNYNKILIPYSL